MKIHHLRNATCVIEIGSDHILIDPMLSDLGTLPSFSYFRHESKPNPIVVLPDTAPAVLDRVTLCLVTHSHKWGFEPFTHTDHLDKAGKDFLRMKNIPVVCPQGDGAYMRKNKLNLVTELEFWQETPLLNGRITAVPARHGHGWISRLMSNGAGFYLDFPGQPSVYICGDTVFTKDVARALTRLKPDISVVAGGSAQMDVGGPILMPMEEIIEFIELAPGQVVVNHLEALNHCPTKRIQLKEELARKDLVSKTLIPEDGQTLIFTDI